MKECLIVDQYRLADLHNADTTAETLELARAEAEAMESKWACKVYVLQVIGEVEGVVEPRWSGVDGVTSECSAG